MFFPNYAPDVPFSRDGGERADRRAPRWVAAKRLTTLRVHGPIDAASDSLQPGGTTMAKTTTAKITPELLHGYLDDALSDEETAQVEKALRESDPLRRQLRAIMQERDRGEHSIGAIWRRQRLSCPSREELGSYLLQVLEVDLQEYIAFHLKTVGC